MYDVSSSRAIYFLVPTTFSLSVLNLISLSVLLWNLYCFFLYWPRHVAVVSDRQCDLALLLGTMNPCV